MGSWEIGTQVYRVGSYGRASAVVVIVADLAPEHH